MKVINDLLSMLSDCKIYIALEKRYVFTIADCDSVAPCYEYCLECIRKHNLKLEEIDLNFPQYFVYDRVKELVMWKVTKQ